MELLRLSSDTLVPISFLIAGISVIFTAISVRNLLFTIPLFVAVIFF